MANTPDLSQYRDLRIYDRDAQAIVDAAIQDLKMKLPEWEPREDNTEVVLLESMALEVSEAVFAINRLPGAVMAIVMQLYGVTRDEGAYPKATIRIRAVDTFGYAVPKGTRFMLTMMEGEDPIVFSTDEAVLIPGGLNSVDVTATGNQFTDAANNVPDGTAFDLLDAIVFIERVELVGSVYGGRGPESDMDWASRGSARLRRLSDVLVTAEHFQSTALESPAISRAFAVDLYNPVGPNPSPGHISVAVYGNNQLVSTPEKAALELELANHSVANLAVHVIDPTITTLDVTVKVHSYLGYADATVDESIREALEAYLNPETWTWAGIVRVNEIIALVDNVEGVDYVSQVVLPAADKVLSGVAPLVRLGTVTVTHV